MATTVVDLLRIAARTRPNAVALVDANEALTFAELELRSDALAAQLVSLGTTPGDRVTIVCENGVPAAVAFLGVLFAGAVAVMLHAQTRAPRMRRVLESSRPVVAIVEGSAAATLALVAGDVPSLVHVVPVTAFAHASDVRVEPTIDASSLAALLFTSGTSGEPKGVMHTHASFVAATRSIADYLDVGLDDHIFSVLPLSFGYGLTQLLLALRTGARLVLERSLAYPGETIEHAIAAEATLFPGVPTIWSTLLRHASFSARSLPSIRSFTNAGDGLPPIVGRALGARFPDASIVAMYGQTECIRATFLPACEYPHRPTSSGLAIPGTAVWVGDSDGRTIPAGTIGELFVRGPHVMRGYWGRPELTEAKIVVHGEHDRTLRTGDLFREDHDGFLHFVGRSDDIVKSRGEKVAPKEVEHALLEMPGVRECAVVGVPDERLGQAIKAFVVLEEGMSATPRAIQHFAAARLEPHAVPQHVEIVASLPRTETGKIRASVLREEDAMPS